MSKEKIGVWMCECGGNISDVVDVSSVLDQVNDKVAVTVKERFLCSKPSVDKIRETMEKEGLDKIILACCTPNMHRKTFLNSLEAQGLNPALLEIVNVREQCSWVHKDDHEGATRKGVDLVRGAVARAHESVPLESKRMETVPEALVIGAGVAGITTSLRLSEYGMKVHLVEKRPSVGGHMIQYPKVFPTMDCSQCILTPKMAEVSQSTNINLITYSEVKEVTGIPGDFNVKVQMKPRGVDVETCTGCDKCAEVCPVKLPNEHDMNLGMRTAIYRPFPQAVPSIYTLDKRGEPACKTTCPAGMNVQGYVALIHERKFKEALELMRKDQPFPAVCGKVCFHPCELECERNNLDEPIAIRALKRFATEYEAKNGIEPVDPIEQVYDEKIAIIGSGPAGLTAAHDLVNKGYPVTVFESRPKLGGMLRYGIPSYRLPKDTLDMEIKRIIDLGIEVKTKTKYGKDVTTEELYKSGYKAVLVAIGAQNSRTLQIQGEDLNGVIQALDLLSDVNAGNNPKLTGKVAIIGGGNVALDAARCATRIGADQVTVLYRRTNLEMPAYQEDVEHAQREGIQFNFLVNPVRFIGENGKLNAVECVRMELGEPDESGRRRPTPIEGSEHFIDVDSVILAIGQTIDRDSIPKEVEVTSTNIIVTDSLTKETSHPQIFACGDIELGPSTVIEAIAGGKEAAESIHRYLRGEDIRAGRDDPIKKVENVSKDGFEVKARQKMPLNKVTNISNSFEETELGFTEEMAVKEAERCLACGGCSECEECLKVCPPECIDLDDPGKEIDLNVGAIVLATGFELFDIGTLPQYGYGVYPNVLTSLEMERVLDVNGPTGSQIIVPKTGKKVKSVAYVLCAGSRDTEVGCAYCSQVCCLYSLKQAQLLRDRGIDVYIHYIDIRASGRRYEEFYRATQEKGALFIKGKVTEIVPEGDQVVVRSEDMMLNRMIETPVDLVVLAPPVVTTEETRKLAEALRVPFDEDKFILERHPKLDPMSTKRDGIYAAGMIIGPKDVQSTTAEAEGAAMKVVNFLKGDRILEPNKAYLANPEACDACMECIKICPEDAITIVNQKAEINDIICSGCGACIPTCPQDALDQQGLTEAQIKATIKGILENSEAEIKILAFVEKAIAYTAADLAGLARLSYPSSIRIIPMPSMARLKKEHLLYAFAHGADGIMMLEAPEHEGPFGYAHVLSEERIDEYRWEIEDDDVDSSRIWFSRVYVPDWRKLKQVFSTFHDIVEDEGPLDDDVRETLLEEYS